jgi:hypothetical protein
MQGTFAPLSADKRKQPALPVSVELCESEEKLFGVTPYNWTIHNSVIVRKHI